MDEIRWVVTQEDAGARADVVLGKRVPGLSRRMARRMALEGKLRVNGHKMPASTRVSPGDELALWITIARPDPSFDLEILRLSRDFVYVHKPAQVHIHRLRPDEPPTLADVVTRAHPECAAASLDSREGGVVHRLDYETSGVVAFARNRRAWSTAREAFACSSVRKLYLALCHPTPGDTAMPRPYVERVESGHILSQNHFWAPPDPGVRVTAPLRRTRHGTEVDPVGLSAESLVWVLTSATDPSNQQRELCLLSLITGRRHQARVHLAWLNRPIVGDSAYGGPPAAQSGFFLHAWGLDLSAAAPEESAVWALLPGSFAAALAELEIPLPKPLDRD